MPAFMSWTEHEGCSTKRFTDPAIIDQLTAGLKSSSQEGIRSSPDQQVSFSCSFEYFPPLLPLNCEGFFNIDVFVSFEGSKADLCMGLRYRQVDYDSISGSSSISSTVTT